MSLKNKVQGFVSWRIEKEATGEVVKESGGSYPNLVVDTGLDNLDSSTMAALTSNCRVGTDATPPAVTDTALGAGVGNASAGGTNAVSASSGAAPWWYSQTRDYVFSASAGIDGVALAEMGFFAGSSASSVMFSRILFKDGTGTPITITLLPDEILIVTYEVRRYVPDTTPVTGSFNIDHGAGPVAYNYSLIPINVDSSSAWGPTIQQSPTGIVTAFENNVLANPEDSAAPDGGLSTGSIGSPTKSTYVPGSFSNSISIDGTISQANFPTGIGGLQFSTAFPNRAMYHVTFSPKIPKDNTETFDFQDFFTHTWDRGALP